jgi:hypothetical protein
VPDEEVHVEAGPEVRLKINGISERGTFEEQDSGLSKGSQESAEFDVADLLDQFRCAESPSGLLAESHREPIGVPDDSGEQEIDVVGGRAIPQPIEFLVYEGSRNRLLG